MTPGTLDPWNPFLKGFTLIELLIVLVIVGLSASIVVPKFGDNIKKARFKSDLKRIYSLVRYAQSRAIFSGKDQHVMFDKNDGAFWMDGKEKMKLYDGDSFGEIRIVKFKEEESDDDAVKVLDFNTNGGTNGGIITVVRESGEEGVVDVKPFESSVTIK